MATASAFPPAVKIWQPLAFIHLHSARILCEKAVEFEAEYKGSQEPLYLFWAHVTGSVFSATAFLEALINETFVRAIMRTKGEAEDSLNNLSSATITSMAQAWSKGVDWNKDHSLLQFVTKQDSRPVEKWYILNKYQVALYFADKSPYRKPFDKTEKLWEDVACLKELRNYLTHHEAETVSFSANRDPYEAETTRRTELLQGLFKRNLRTSLYGEGSVLSFLGSECASWAVDSSVTLAKEFRDKMILAPASIPGL